MRLVVLFLKDGQYGCGITDHSLKKVKRKYCVISWVYSPIPYEIMSRARLMDKKENFLVEFDKMVREKHAAHFLYLSVSHDSEEIQMEYRKNSREKDDYVKKKNYQISERGKFLVKKNIEPTTQRDQLAKEIYMTFGECFAYFHSNKSYIYWMANKEAIQETIEKLK